MRLWSLPLLALILSIASPVFAGQFGPAQAQTKPGQVALGVGAFAYSDEWTFNGLNGIGVTTDVRQTQAYVQLNVGLFPNWEIYLQGGGADLAADGVLNLSDFKDTMGPFGTIGLKGLLRKGKYLDLGAFAEASYFPEYEDRQTRGNSRDLIIVEEALAVNAGLLFQREIEGAILYGGPVFHYREADFWAVINNVGFDVNTVEEEDNLGGVLGIRWVANKDIVIEAEVQLRNNFSAGAAISFLY